MDRRHILHNRISGYDWTKTPTPAGSEDDFQEALQAHINYVLEEGTVLPTSDNLVRLEPRDADAAIELLERQRAAEHSRRRQKQLEYRGDPLLAAAWILGLSWGFAVGILFIRFYDWVSR